MANLKEQAEAIADAYLAKKDKPAYKRITNADRALMLHLHAEGKTQTEIAQRIGCTQPAVSQWLSQCNDSRREATLYLRGKALSMARKIVNKGQAKDLVRTLEGIEVLQAPTQDRQINLQINGIVLHGTGEAARSLVGTHALSPQLSGDMHSLSGDSAEAKVNIKPLISNSLEAQ